MQLNIHTDGGARGNPGPAAIGVVIEERQSSGYLPLTAFGKNIGETTNNVAEYTAVVEALLYLRDHLKQTENKEMHFYLDSLLVVNQLNGIFRIKDSRLQLFAFEIRKLEQEVGGVVTYTYVPREQNSKADALVNKALDFAHVT